MDGNISLENRLELCNSKLSEKEKMKKIPAALLFLSAAALAGADSLTISECYKLARENYPMIRQFGLIKESEKYDLENATSGYLPQFSISANAMYLSDSPEVMGQSLLPQ